jgi:hypothetical protein
LGTVIASNKVLPLDKKFPSFGHTVHVIFGDPELLDEVQLRITTLEVPR